MQMEKMSTSTMLKESHKKVVIEMDTKNLRAIETEQKVPTLEERIEALEREVAEIKEELPKNRVTMVVFSGELDRVLAAFVIATGAAALGMEVSMFFTFWGLSTLKRRSELKGKNIFEKLLALMTPSGTKEMPLSQLNFFGVGAKLLRFMMNQKDVATLEELIEMAREMGVRMIACQMSMDVMGIRKEELIDGIEVGGAATYLGDAVKSKVTLFI
jgi:peroxiredoxin family protein